MAIKTKIVQITANTSLGLTPITGIGFKPNYMRVIRSIDNDSLDLANYRIHLGVATSPTEQWAMSTYSRDNVAEVDNKLISSVNNVISHTTNTGLKVSASLVSFDADGATLNYTTAQAAFGFVVLFAEFPPEIKVKAGTVTLPNTVGQFSETGLSFQPKFLEVSSTNTPFQDTEISALLYLHGFTDGTNTYSVSNYEQDGQVESNAVRTHSNTYLLQRSLGVSSAPDFKVSFASFDSDGFTLDVIDPVDSSQDLPYVAFGGDIDISLHEVTQQANGNQVVSGVGFSPELTLSLGASLTSLEYDTDGVENSSMSQGFATDTGQNSIRAIARNGTSTTDTFVKFSNNSLMNAYSADQNTSNGNASYLGSNADGYTLDWTNSDGVARLFFNVSFATASAAVGNDLTLTSTMPSMDSTLGLNQFVPVNSIGIGSLMPSMASGATLNILSPEFDSAINSEMPSMTSTVSMSVFEVGYDSSINSTMPSMFSAVSLTVGEPVDLSTQISSVMPSMNSLLRMTNGDIQTIGNVTASFKDSGINVKYKLNEITVNFK